MTSSFLPGVHDRVVRLTRTLGVLKERVREAVATEVGRAVADAVRDVLTAALRRRPVETGEPDRPREYRPCGGGPLGGRRARPVGAPAVPLSATATPIGTGRPSVRSRRKP